MGIEPCIVKGDGGPADGIGDVVSQASQGCRGDCWGGARVVAVESGWWKEAEFSLSSFQAQNHMMLLVIVCLSHVHESQLSQQQMTTSDSATTHHYRSFNVPIWNSK